MSWFPIGPDFVFAPHNTTFKRLSLRNEQGRQCLVGEIAIDSSDPDTIYTVERPVPTGASAFRTRDGGRSWTSIADSLQQTDPNIDPMCLAINPSHPEIVYMGTGLNRSVYVSSNRGEPGSWTAGDPLPGLVRKLIVDPRSAGTPGSTILYAATTTGVFRSADGGVNWGRPALVPGDIWALEAHFPAGGAAQFFATSRGRGVFYAKDSNVTAAWRNLNEVPPGGTGIGLPSPGTFDALLVGICARNPARLYVWMFDSSYTTQTKLWTTSAPETKWTSIAMTAPPSPWYGYYAMSFAVAPNSPGDGLNDILLFGSGGISRSIDSGRSWQLEGEGELFHADQHAIAFHPAAPAAGTVPTTYIGCDGGIAKSSRFADPSFDISARPPHHNEGPALADTGGWQNLNHGKQSIAVRACASPPAAPQLTYLAAQDTGVNAGGTALGWRSLEDSDGSAVAAATGLKGVNVWAGLGMFKERWPAFRLLHWVDTGELATSWSFVTRGASFVAGTSNCENGLAGSCISGGVALGGDTTLAQSVSAGRAPQAVEPASMAGIVVGSVLLIEARTSNEEMVAVTAVSADSFTAIVRRDHAAGATLARQQAHVLRIEDAVATPVSQDFAPDLWVNVVAVGATNANIACAFGNQRVFITNVLHIATAATAWTEVTSGRPASSLSDIAVSPSDRIYVLLEQPVTAGGITTPLFEVSGGSWQPQQCSGLPTGFWFGKLAADPLDSDLLYAGHGARVYRLAMSGGAWGWTDISEGLPGQWVLDLGARATGSRGAPQVLLRAAIPTRGVFERDARQTDPDPAISLYLRDHPMDSGWGAQSADPVMNPYRPAEWFWHYMCADVKLDAHEVAPGTGAFYQTDPEGNPIPPLDHVRFDQLRDDSSNLPQADVARVHVQVRNRSHDPSGDVTVWALYCNASAGPPALSASPSQGNAFPFWSQFNADGTIAPNLPSDSPWHPVGPPQTIAGLSAAAPKVASWVWTVPTLDSSADPGHFCLAVFVHSAASPIGETSRFSVDELAVVNRQVGQKNLHVGAPLAASPSPGGGGGTAGGAPGSGAKLFEYIEFHNPTAEERVSDLIFDLRRIPAALGVTLQLTPLQTEKPLPESLTGIASTRPTQAGDELPEKKEIPVLGRLWRLILAIVCRLVNLVRLLFGRPTKPCGRAKVRLPQFESGVHEAESGERVAVEGVKLAPFGWAAALVAFEPVGQLPPGETFTVDIQQWEGGEILVGGSFYVMSTKGKKSRPKDEVPGPPAMDHHSDRELVERLEREGEELRYEPPFLKKLAEQRESEQEKR